MFKEMFWDFASLYLSCTCV